MADPSIAAFQMFCRPASPERSRARRNPCLIHLTNTLKRQYRAYNHWGVEGAKIRQCPQRVRSRQLPNCSIGRLLANSGSRKKKHKEAEQGSHVESHVLMKGTLVLLSSHGISTRAYRLNAGNTAHPISTLIGTSPDRKHLRRYDMERLAASVGGCWKRVTSLLTIPALLTLKYHFGTAR